jgi:hypothetical protein
LTPTVRATSGAEPPSHGSLLMPQSGEASFAAQQQDLSPWGSGRQEHWCMAAVTQAIGTARGARQAKAGVSP